VDRKKTTFALFFGNRGFFPSSLIAQARREIPEVLERLGHEVLMMDDAATRFGAVETVQEGETFARFLHSNQGKYQGIILSLPNFGDESGAAVALKGAGVPILIQAYPDELNQLGPDQRRDSFCGKFSIMDVFIQYGIPFTVLKPHTVHPQSETFRDNIAYFDRLCRVTSGMRGLTVGSLGARTTPFKTVRYDEITLQRHGITVETLDLSDIFNRMDAVDLSSGQSKTKAHQLKEYASWDGVPENSFLNLVRLAVVLDEVIDEYRLKALAIRCWTEIQSRYGISPCVVTSRLMDGLVPAACEVDVANAVSMFALSQASGAPSGILDWNNNYGQEENKCILFHCGNMAQSLMVERGRISDHAILQNTLGPGTGFGCSQGRIRPFPFTFASMLTSAGRMHFYVGQGRFTEDPIAPEFFGCAGVAEIDDLQEVLLKIGKAGHRHHVSVTPGHHASPVLEAFQGYLGYEVMIV
jgi:L-fucose isomerase-like protein